MTEPNPIRGQVIARVPTTRDSALVVSVHGLRAELYLDAAGRPTRWLTTLARDGMARLRDALDAAFRGEQTSDGLESAPAKGPVIRRGPHFGDDGRLVRPGMER